MMVPDNVVTTSWLSMRPARDALQVAACARSRRAPRDPGEGGTMIGFILTGHGQYAAGLASAIEMVAGDQPALAIVPFEDARAASYGDDLRTAIADMRAACDGVLVFVDLLGGTPFNQAMTISDGLDDVEVVTGANLSMMIELLLTRGAAPSIGEMATRAVEAGRAGITHGTVLADAAGSVGAPDIVNNADEEVSHGGQRAQAAAL